MYEAKWEKIHKDINEEIEDLRDRKRKLVMQETQMESEARNVRESMAQPGAAANIQKIQVFLKNLDTKLEDLRKSIYASNNNESIDNKIRKKTDEMNTLDETANANLRLIRDASTKILKKIEKNNAVSTTQDFDFKGADLTERAKKINEKDGSILGNVWKSIKQADGIVAAYQKCLKSITAELDTFYATNLDSYIHDIRKKYSYVKTVQRELKSRLAMNGKLSDEDIELTQKYQTQLSKTEELITLAQKLGEETKTNLKRVSQNISSVCSAIKVYQKKLDRDSDIVDMERACDALIAHANKAEEKLRDLYNNEVSIMDVIVDNNFIMLYVLKLLQYGLLVGAVFLTEKIFSNMYMQQVYANNGDPPNLLTMLAIFVAIDVAFALFLVTALYLISVIMKSQGKRNFFINDRLVKKFMIDYAFATLVLFVLLAIIAAYMQAKKYFRYKTEGLRAIRAFGDMTISLAPVILLVPYFAIF